MTLNLILLTMLVVAAVWAVMTRSLLISAVGLAVVSILLTLVLFQLNAPLAAVFELSVCAGLITVIFISTISLTKPMTRSELKEQTKGRIKRYWYLPVLVAVAALLLGFYMVLPDIQPLNTSLESDVRNILWKLRQTDILGQIVIILAGVFGVVVLFKERMKYDK